MLYTACGVQLVGHFSPSDMARGTGRVVTTITLEHKLYPLLTTLNVATQPTDTNNFGDTTAPLNQNPWLPQETGRRGEERLSGMVREGVEGWEESTGWRLESRIKEGGGCMGQNDKYRDIRYSCKWPTRPPESLIESGDDPFTRNISEPTTTERFILTSAKPSTIHNEEGCGKPIIPNHLIRNGVETERGDWPWLAALYTINTLGGIDFWCSGTLINNKHIVTALSTARLKPILWDGGREGERCGVASQPTKVYFCANKNRWITETVDGASYQRDISCCWVEGRRGVSHYQPPCRLATCNVQGQKQLTHYVVVLGGRAIGCRMGGTCRWRSGGHTWLEAELALPCKHTMLVVLGGRATEFRVGDAHR
uniref:Peptidase S1 domain-containing protein n=1 Tax=Timema monikensis TaxID=170555 RepID=A0A7R9E246_9NEOP|nr:unnamed protein product [Timema monikensis]